MTNKIALTAILAVLVASAAFATSPDIEPQSPTHATEDCEGAPIGDATGGTVNYSAMYEPNIYEISLNQAGGSGELNTIYEKYGIGWYKSYNSSTGVSNEITTSAGLNLPTYTGYTFGGYYTEQNGSGTQIITNTGVLSGTAGNERFAQSTDAPVGATHFVANAGTLYANWTVNGHTISYNCGTGDSNSNLVSSENIDFNAAWSGIVTGNRIISGEVAGCSKSGSHPTGWSCTYNDTAYNLDPYGVTNYGIYNSTSGDISVDKDATCTLQWEANTITLQWNPDNGNTMPNTECIYDTEDGLTIPPNPQKTGHTFMGWEIVSD